MSKTQKIDKCEGACIYLWDLHKFNFLTNIWFKKREQRCCRRHNDNRTL